MCVCVCSPRGRAVLAQLRIPGRARANKRAAATAAGVSPGRTPPGRAVNTHTHTHTHTQGNHDDELLFDDYYHFIFHHDDDLHHNANYDQAYDQAFHALQMFGHGTRQVRFLISFLEWFCVRIHVHSGLGRATSVRASPQHFGVCVCEFHVSPAWT